MRNPNPKNMNQFILAKEPVLTEEENSEFVERFNLIANALDTRNKATSEAIGHVQEICKKKLWRQDFISEADFIRSVLNIEQSSFHRYVWANKSYLYLMERAETDEERKSIALMTEYPHREIRRLAIGDDKILKRANETVNQYEQRKIQREEENLEKIYNVWKLVYNKISRVDKQLPSGGFRITDGKIKEVIDVIQDINKQQPIIDVEGKSISVEEVVTKYSPEVVDALIDIGLSDRLLENKLRQREHIKDSMEKKYSYDKYEGELVYIGGKFYLRTDYGDYSLEERFARSLNTVIEITIKEERIFN